MPELAEVETVRRATEVALLGKKIVAVWAATDPLVFDEQGPEEVANMLQGATLRGSERRGKYFWWNFGKRGSLLMHLGMTGWVEVYGSEAQRPRFLKLEVVVSGGTRVGFRDARRLGRIRLREAVMEVPPVSNLGFDPFLNLPPARFFIEHFARRTAPIKAVLLDQAFSAGIGNWLADEILYQARIDPRRAASSLIEAEVKAVRSAMKRIVNKAVAVGADDEKFPASWLFHVRWGKAEGAATASGERLAFTTVGGRTTAWVPAVQR